MKDMSIGKIIVYVLGGCLLGLLAGLMARSWLVGIGLPIMIGVLYLMRKSIKDN